MKRATTYVRPTAGCTCLGGPYSCTCPDPLHSRIARRERRGLALIFITVALVAAAAVYALVTWWTG